MKIKLIIIILSISSGLIFAQKTFSSSEEIIKFGIENSKEIKEKEIFYKEKINSTKLNIEGFLPKLGISYNEVNFVPINSTDTRTKALELSLTQKIYDNRKEELTYKYNKQIALTDYLQFEQSIQNFKLQILEKYYLLILQIKSIELKNELLKNMKNELNIYEFEYKNGISLKSDYLEYKISINDLENQIQNLLNEKEKIKTELLELLNIDLNEELILKESLEEIKIDMTKISREKQAIEEKILNNDIDLKKLIVQIAFQKQQLKINKLFFLPSISLQGSIKFDGTSLPLTQPSYSIRLILSFDSLPFFPVNYSKDLGIKEKRINELNNSSATNIRPQFNYFSNQKIVKSEYNQALIEKEKTINAIKKTSIELINQHDASIEYISLLNDSIKLKSEKLEITKYQANNGLITIDNYLNEKINLHETKLNLIKQKINLLIIQTKISILSGEKK